MSTHYADTYRVVVLREPDGYAFAAIGGLASPAVALAVATSQARFCRDVHGFRALFRVFRVGQSGIVDVTGDVLDDPEETAAHDAEIEARHGAYHGRCPTCHEPDGHAPSCPLAPCPYPGCLGTADGASCRHPLPGDES